MEHRLAFLVRIFAALTVLAVPFLGCSNDNNNDNDAGDTESDTDTDYPTDCTGFDDFTFCSVVTDPDRSYDICVDEVCVSPGCGDATCNVPSPHFPIADTGQRTCCDEIGEITCPSPGEDFFGQDAQYGWDTAHTSGERFTRSTPVAGSPVVADNVTGLVWQGCATGYSGELCESEDGVSKFSWVDSVVLCDALDWGGYHDWRLPDPYELDSIIDASLASTSPNILIDESAFPRSGDCGLSGVWGSYWASSSSPENAIWASEVDFCRGYVTSWADDKGGQLFVRCVRSGPMEARSFEVDFLSGDRVVVDTHTALMWQGCTAGQTGESCSGEGTLLSWQAALAFCENLSLAGFNDWRVPNKKELFSTTDGRVVNPAVDSVAFPSLPSSSNYFWTSSSVAGFDDTPSAAWMVAFDGGECQPLEKNSGIYVRCVRG
jgi:hypothetical protein